MQITPSLQPPTWTDSGAAQPGTGGVLTFTDPGAATNGPSRFYRVRVQWASWWGQRPRESMARFSTPGRLFSGTKTFS